MIYLDNAATTRMSKDVLMSVNQCSVEYYSNPSSSHYYAKELTKLIEDARCKVAALIGGKPEEVSFNSGATEGINTILRGYVEANIEKGAHVITTKVEHKAVLATCDYLENIGLEVSYLDVDENGQVDIDQLKGSIRDDTLLVAMLWVNNETGVMQDIEEISRIVKGTGAKLFVDATQVAGKLPIDVEEMGVDLLCLSGHKFHGPKGVGAIYVKEGIKLAPLLYGGGQEEGLRSGTLNVSGIVGLGKACELSEVNNSEVITVMSYLEQSIKKNFDAYIIGENTRRSPYISNVVFKGADADIVIGKLKETMVSSGSACTSRIVEPSHVLTNMGLGQDESFSSLRFSISKYTTMEEIDKAIQELREVL